MSDTDTSTTTSDAAADTEASAEASTTPTSEATTPSATPTTTPTTPAAPTEDVSGLKAALEAVRKDFKAAQKELNTFKQSAMSDQEKAIEAAKAAGLAEATAKYGKRLALAEFRSAAVEAGAELGGVLDLIDMGRFLTEDGEVDSKAIGKAVAALPKAAPAAPAPTGPPASRSGGDHRGGTGAGAPITREQLAGMTSAEIAAAHAEGRLGHLL